MQISRLLTTCLNFVTNTFQANAKAQEQAHVSFFKNHLV
jgi:hypothetical protein